MRPQPPQRIDLHPAQWAFRQSAALYRGFVGGRGAGKSFVGAYDLLRRAKPLRLYGVYAPTYRMLKDATLRTFLSLARHLRFLRSYHKGDMVAVLGNGSEVFFRSVDDPEGARGPNISGAWVDEASLCPAEAFQIIIAALREAGEQGWFAATFTPKGKSHWTYPTLGTGRPDTALFHAKTSDNPFLPPQFYAAVRSQYTSEYAAQELDGQFIELKGNLCQREWFAIVDAIPAQAQRLRSWDLAATEKKLSKDDPDWTVGTLLAYHRGQVYIEHVVRRQVGPSKVRPLIVQTAELDGRRVPVRIEQEPGASGKIVAEDFVRALAGWEIVTEPSTGDKIARAMPFLAQAEAGNVCLVRGEWNGEWLDEFVGFPKGAHDDMVDSASGGFAELMRRVRGDSRLEDVVTVSREALWGEDRWVW
ncbi:MAG: phage terminase large subunit [Armatimonadetes bacterium]|nr:phage terminase large subunit [Armatimonadota bacterium]